MRTTPSTIQLENPDPPPPPTPARHHVPYWRQAAAHLYFIAAGLHLTLRATLRGRTTPCGERLHLHHRFARYIALLERWGIIDVEFAGFEPAASWRGSVIAPNHPSILDALLLCSRLPGLDCVMNSRLLRDPVMSGTAHLCGFIRNDTPLSMVRDTRDRLVAGDNVLIFPEGTRTNENPVGSFRHGFALAAARAGAPVRTVLVECDSDYFGRNFNFFRSAPCPIRYRLTASRVFFPADDEDPRVTSAEIEEFFRASLVRDENGVRRRLP
jgi:1-acyl-sn-glycerol-3-phosphate acyltransferase